MADATLSKVPHDADASEWESTLSATASDDSYLLPEMFTCLPPVRDLHPSDTSQKQDATIQECLPFMANLVEGNFNKHGVPNLDRPRHVRFLQHHLGRLPAGFVAADSTRPWFLYWALAALHLLGEDVGAQYRESLAETVRPMQNSGGGFGGGFGQMSHIATTYAIVLALALVGGEEAYEVVDRRAMWKWLGRLKCPDGGFLTCLGGEEDIRGSYCAAVIISLLNLPLDLPSDAPAAAALAAFSDKPDLLTGLGNHVRKCQTFEGGISGQPDAEAHGAYAFCALGCLSILDTPHKIMPKYLNVPRLVAWLSSRQYAPEGGFSGRTNKLVDGCYSHWVGGCWPLIEACLDGAEAAAAAAAGIADTATEPTPGEARESFYNREGLIRYVLCCCQDTTRRGGLRDKPSKPSDAYHTCYALTGLSSAQHKWRASQADEATLASEVPEHTIWSASPCAEAAGAQIFDEEDRVPTMHPVYSIPQKAVRDIRQYFCRKLGF